MGWGKREIKNATITSTHLGYEDHGIFTAYINLDYGGGGQSFGGYAFSQYEDNKKAKGKQVSADRFTGEFILRLIDAIGVKSWEELAGKHCRVDAEHTKVHRLGHFLEDKWFNPEELRKEIFPEIYKEEGNEGNFKVD